MAEKFQIYKCGRCGNVIEVIEAHEGTLACCGEPMALQKENTTDGASEKHVPMVEETGFGFTVKVGEVEHPMAEEHFIERIELSVDGRLYSKSLEPHDKPEAHFYVKAADSHKVFAREYCNLHRLWKSKH